MNFHINLIEIIFFVTDQDISTDFYQKLLAKNPDLHVPGMTEFMLADNCKLGLMPKKGIAGLLQLEIVQPVEPTHFPGCELYLYVDDVEPAFKHALQCGAKLLSPVAKRDWGDTVCYFADPDGNLIAFAQKTTSI